MAKKIVVENREWENGDNKFKYCQALEQGDILFFPSMPFSFAQSDIDFLLTQRQGGSATRKNIAYKPQIDRITNHNGANAEERTRLKEVLRNYSKQATEFLSVLLAPYEKGWKHDYASFRPFQEKGRKLRLRARNDLLHIDAFPTRPLHGTRILRFFTNINPTESRHWITSSGFAELAQEYAAKIAVPPSESYRLAGRLERKLKQWLKKLGVKIALRSPYDTFMLNMHNFLKENSEFQEKCSKDHWDFPPGSCWAAFTDQLSHAALAGQYALEQTFLVPQKVLLCPEKSPISVLERLSGRNLVDAEFLREVW